MADMGILVDRTIDGNGYGTYSPVSGSYLYIDTLLATSRIHTRYALHIIRCTEDANNRIERPTTPIWDRPPDIIPVCGTQLDHSATNTTIVIQVV